MTPEVRARQAAQDAASSLLGDTAGPSEPEGAGDAGEAGGPTSSGNGGNGQSTKAQQGAGAPASSALTDTPPVLPARISGLDLGPACSQCGGMMQRTGSCYTCGSCGFNTGCG